MASKEKKKIKRKSRRSGKRTHKRSSNKEKKKIKRKKRCSKSYMRRLRKERLLYEAYEAYKTCTDKNNCDKYTEICKNPKYEKIIRTTVRNDTKRCHANMVKKAKIYEENLKKQNKDGFSYKVKKD